MLPSRRVRTATLWSRETSHPRPAPAAIPAATATTVTNGQIYSNLLLQTLRCSHNSHPRDKLHSQPCGTTPQPSNHEEHAPAYALWTLIQSPFAPSAKLLPNWGTGVTPEAASIPQTLEKAHRLTRHLAAQLRSAAQQKRGGADVVVHVDLSANDTLLSNTLIYLVARQELMELM